MSEDIVDYLRETWTLEGVGPITRAQRQRVHDAAAEIVALREQLAGAEKALVYIRNEAERENGGWVHLKRCIAVQSRAALTAIAAGQYKGEQS